MKKLILFCFVLMAWNAQAFDVYNGTNLAGKPQWSSSSVIMNAKDGLPDLKQDMINNANSPQTSRTFGYMFGRNSLVQNVRCDLWEGPTCVYVFPTVAQQMAVSSTSANDAAAGTGCQQVEIHYLDGSYLIHSTLVTLNGVTPVNTTPTDLFRINSFHCIAVGSGGVSAGNISLKNTGATVTYGFMLAGNNIAHQAIFTIPAASYGYISHWQASVGSATGTHFTQVDIRATQHDGNYVPGLFLTVDTIGLQNSGVGLTLPIPIRIPAMTDVKMSALSDAANANAVVTGAVMGWFEAQ